MQKKMSLFRNKKRSFRKRVLLASLRIGAGVGIFIFGAWIYLAQPSFSKNTPATKRADQSRLRDVVKKLSTDFHPRNYRETENLSQCASYIYEHFQRAGGNPEYQNFQARGRDYKNIRCLFGPPSGERLIIGAHYDSFDQTPGADDNASGVAGVIELAYLLAGEKLSFPVELVAFPLEEPPFFAGDDMGSCHHARQLHEDKTNVRGVIILEMIGYFSTEARSQHFPLRLLKCIYPDTGDFIAVAGSIHDRSLAKKVKTGMKGSTSLLVFSINAPKKIPGIDFSDHRNYWPYGWEAVMITDTAFYRNPNYHTTTDTWDTLNYERLGDVVTAVHHMIIFESGVNRNARPPEKATHTGMNETAVTE